MDLFRHDPSINLLPCDGVAHYHGPILNGMEAQGYFDALLAGVPWRHDELVIFGQRRVTARKVAWYGDRPYAYAYSGTVKQALPWSAELLALKALVEKRSQATYNSCLLNLYHDGSEGMSWHSDDEKTILKDAPNASVSLGAQRKFSFRHKVSKETVSLTLEDGSLLVMKGTTQTHWLHSLPKSTKITAPRINLTFRTMAE
ncbi:MAG TPA: alpha-ketoglutarate-dependent dioxygenase AlkB [Candidatus Limnocylindria bacterium]|nr:alpha-ketoglutarate-dependent dioxygenase AlkB [Candidatus Limnocylindria bacterium]